MPPTRTWSARAVLTAAVFVAGVVNGLTGEFLLFGVRPPGVGLITGGLLLDAFATVIVALVPPVFVFIACQYAPIRSLSIRAVAAVGLLAGLAGRYTGSAVGSLLAGRTIPTPVALVTRADLSVGLDNPVLTLVILLGLAATGLWPMVGTLAGIGLESLVATSGVAEDEWMDG